VYPGQIAPGSYPYAVAPSVTVRVDLIEGEGTQGVVLHSTIRTLTAPFMDFVDVDYTAAGVVLGVGQKYTLLLSDVSGQVYPQGVTGWVVPSVTDLTTGAGAYVEGLPILQGALVGNDVGIGDNSFQVIANSPVPQTVSGVNGVITAYVARNPGFIVINGGLNLLDHLWTSNLNPGNTTFLGGLVNWYQTGLLVDYVGVVTSQGVLLTQLTVKPRPLPLVVDLANLPNGTVGVGYSAAVHFSGGVAPYTVQVTGLPSGLSFDGTQIVGTPSVSGTWSLSVTVSDAIGLVSAGNPSVTIQPAPGNYTILDENKGKITAVGLNCLYVGTKKLVWNSNTIILVNGAPVGQRSTIGSYVRAGMRIQWKGLRDANTGTVMMNKVEIN
jgi:hypothetical protein